MDLVVVLGWTAFAGAALYAGLPPGPLRVALALPLVLVFPGYALLSALFPDRPTAEHLTEQQGGASLGGIERLALSVALSLALVPMVAFVANYTSYGVRFRPLLAAVVVVTLALTVVGFVRRLALDADRRYGFSPLGWLSGASSRFLSTSRDLRESPPLKPTSGGQRMFNVLFLVSLLTLTATAGYAAVSPPANDQPFTEFYLLTQTGDGEFVSEDLPHEFSSGESQSLWVAIGNHEKQRVPYTVVVQLDGQEIDRFSTSVEAGHTKRLERSIQPDQTGDRLRLSFLLYRGNVPDDPSPENAYRESQLWITVS